MKNNTLIIASSLLLLASSNAVLAVDKNKLTGSGEASFSNSTGNTEEQTLYSALKLDYKQDTYSVNGLLEANSTKQNNVQTKERYVADVQGNRNFPSMPKAYAFGQVRFENDRFEFIDLSSYYVLGGGYKIITEKTTTLTAEAGLGFQQVNFNKKSSNDDISQATLKLKINFKHQINENVDFTQDATEYYGQDQAKFESNTGLSVKMSKALSLKATYKFRHNNAPAGNKNVDTELVLGVIYDF